MRVVFGNIFDAINNCFAIGGYFLINDDDNDRTFIILKKEKVSILGTIFPHLPKMFTYQIINDR